MTDRATMARPRVLHFVTGGFSGATQVAVDLVSAHRASGRFDARLVPVSYTHLTLPTILLV